MAPVPVFSAFKYATLVIAVSWTVSCADINESKEKLLYYESKGLSDMLLIGPSHFVANSELQEKCQNLLWNFAEASSNFTYCAVKHASPIRVCEKCVRQYYKAISEFEAMQNKTITDYGMSCDEFLLHSDRIQVANRVSSQINQIWLESYCENCYSMTWDNATVPCLSNDTKTFYHLLNETLECFHVFDNGSDSKLVPLADMHKNDSVCYVCKHKYRTVNKFYSELVEKFDSSFMCMDIVDMMNTTRWLWSRRYQCVKFRDSTFALMCTICFVFLFPPIFYIGSYRNSDPQNSHILQQKRLDTSRSEAHLMINS